MPVASALVARWAMVDGAVVVFVGAPALLEGKERHPLPKRPKDHASIEAPRRILARDAGST